MREIGHRDQLHLRRFSAVDRDTPIIECVVNDEILFDVAREEGVFCVTIPGTSIPFVIAADVLSKTIEDAKRMIVDAETSDGQE